MWNGHLERVITAKNRIKVAEDKVRAAQSASRSVEPTARRFAATETNRILPEELIEKKTTELATPVVLVPEQHGSFRLCVDYGELNAVMIGHSYRHH